MPLFKFKVSDNLGKIQEILIDSELTKDIKIPEIVVIGSQSSGKSSLLDILIGTPFLPKGEGIVTKSPIVIQSINNESLSDYKLSVVQGNHQSNYSDFNELSLNITNITKKILGKNNGVSNKPILVKMEGPGLPTLSCVDLPGITRIAVEGQPSDI